MSLKRILVSILAAGGIGAGHVASAAAQQNEARQAAIANGQQSGKSIEANLAGDFTGSILGHSRRYSHTPYEWGISKACAQMRRKNSMRSLGIAGSRI